MKPSVIVRYISFVLLVIAAFMLLSAIVSIIYGDSAFFALLMSAVITATVGIFPFIFVPKNPNLNNREIHFFVVFAWLSTCLFGMLPYVLWGGEFSVANAWFESVSGFTTTGATILNNVESLPPGLLFWRSSTHYIGGIGVVMFALLVLQSRRTTQQRLTNAEMSQLAKDNFRFKTYQTLHVILSVYIGITIAETVLLVFCGMNLFDAINHAFSTVATGGFSTKNLSIASFNSTSIGIVIIIFMFISGLHFGMIYSAIAGRSMSLFRSPIVRFYLATIIITTLLVTINLLSSGTYSNLPKSLYHASFQVVSVITTTGFATADTTIWPTFTICVLIYLSIQCACAGSTSGGVKTDRVYILYKTIAAQIKGRLYPNAVVPIRTAGKLVDKSIVISSTTYILLFLALSFIAAAILSIFNIDMLSTFSLSISFLSNVGPAFGSFGSLGNYDSLPEIIKITYPVLMLVGRLEIYGLFVVLIKSKYN